MSKNAQTQNIAQLLDDDYTPTKEEFEELLKEQSQFDTKKWTDLEINNIYTITDYREINTDNGVSVILTLKDNGEVWSPAHLTKKIEGKEPPFYVRPLGLKPCKNNKKNKYHAYDLVFPKKESNYMHKDYVKK